MKKNIFIPLVFLLAFIILFFLIRVVSIKEIDDVSSEIPCLEDYLKKADVLWIIPKFNNKPISEDQKWCNYILSLNKTLGLHGVTHKFEEFDNLKDKGYLDEGIKIFEQCFGFKPEIFKSPQLKISKDNRKLIQENNLKLKNKFNQFFHKIYHCNDSGLFSNRFIDFF